VQLTGTGVGVGTGVEIALRISLFGADQGDLGREIDEHACV